MSGAPVWRQHQEQQNKDTGFEKWFKGQSVFVMENWMPKELYTEENTFTEYKLKVPGKLTGWM